HARVRHEAGVPHPGVGRRAPDRRVRPRSRGRRVARAGHAGDPSRRHARDHARHDPAVPDLLGGLPGRRQGAARPVAVQLHYTNLLIVVAVGFAAPLLLGFFPKVRVPSVVLELIAGFAVGPAVLGWVHVEAPVSVLSAVGLAILLFLAGLEIEFHKLRGQVLRLTGIGFLVSFAIAIALGLAFHAAGVVKSPLFLAIVLCATSLGVLVPVLKDAGEIGSKFGQIVIAAGSIADFGAVILLSLFFSRQAKSTTTQVLLLGGLIAVSILIGLTIRGVEHSARIRSVLNMLQ